MISSRDRVGSVSPRRTRRELVAAGEHLVSAARHGASQVSQTSRSQTKLARDRATAAAIALRGQSRTSWRWLAAGLTAGLVLGAAAARALAGGAGAAAPASTDRTADQTPAATATIRERTGATAEAVRDATRVALNSAAVTAHQAAAKVRNTLAGHNSADKPAPTNTVPPSPDGA